MRIIFGHSLTHANHRVEICEPTKQFANTPPKKKTSLHQTVRDPGHHVVAMAVFFGGVSRRNRIVWAFSVPHDANHLCRRVCEPSKRRRRGTLLTKQQENLLKKKRYHRDHNEDCNVGLGCNPLPCASSVLGRLFPPTRTGGWNVGGAQVIGHREQLALLCPANTVFTRPSQNVRIMSSSQDA